MKVNVSRFNGILPRTNAALLQDNDAQVAANCSLWNGDLRSLRDTTAIFTPTALGGVIKSIYRIGNAYGDSQFWMAWTGDVDVASGSIAGDTSERVYFTGDGVPKVTNLTMATQGGSAYPVNSYTLGIPIPTQAPLCAASSNLDPVDTRVYLYTYVSAWGEEGVPSAPTSLTVSQSGTVVLSGMSGAPTGNFNIVSKRIYRSQNTASGGAIYRFVAEIPVGQNTYNDTLLATDLAEQLSTLEFNMPPATMKGIISLENGMKAAFDGQDILFCEPFIPYAWPAKYRLTADFPIVGLGVFGSTLVVLTTGYPHLVSGTHPSNMNMERMPLGRSCASKRSIVNADDGVIYASSDGLVFVGHGGAKLITNKQFTDREWKLLNPATIEGHWVAGRYVGTFTGGGGFVLDNLADPDWTTIDETVTAGHVNMNSESLYLCIAGVIRKWNAGANKTYTWRGKKFQFVGAASPAFARVDADAYPVTFKLYNDGVLLHTETVSSERPFPLSVPNQRPREVEIELSGTNPVRSVGFVDAFEEFNIG